MAKPPKKPLVAACIIERHDNTMLIVLPASAENQPRLWQFPRGFAQPGEAAEAAVRRIAREQLGVEVEAVVGQPPLIQTIEGREAEVRYFFCGILDGQPHTGPYAELRFVPRAHLREYDFDPPSREVVQWLLTG